MPGFLISILEREKLHWPITTIIDRLVLEISLQHHNLYNNFTWAWWWWC